MNASSGRRKHQVKVRSIVGVHESLLAILEDSNTIALCGNSTSGDNFPSPPSTLERDEKSSSKRYTFDACFPVKGNEAGWEWKLLLSIRPLTFTVLNQSLIMEKNLH